MASPIAQAFVRISPNLTKFRAELEAELTAAMAGISKSIPVSPISVPVTAQGGRAAGASIAEKEALALAAAQRAEAGIAFQVATAANAAAVGTADLAIAQAALKDATTAAAAATDLQTKALALGNVELAQRAGLLAVEATNAKESLAGSAVTVAAQSRIAFSRREEELLRETARTAEVSEKLKRAAFDATEKKVREEAAVANAAAKEQIAGYKETQLAAETAAARMVDAEQSVGKARKASALASGEVSSARVLATKLAGSEKIAEDALKLSIATQNPVLQANARELLTNITLEKQHAENALIDARAQAKLTAAAAQQATTQATVARGIGATALSFVGLRGATLAASAPFLIGAASAAILVKSLGQFGGFEKQLNVFRATTEATDEQLKAVSETAQQLGKDITLPGVSASDAAEAMTSLAKAGLTVEQAMAGARGTLQLATAAQIDNADAANLAANALNAFALSGEDAAHVADVFANAANAAQGDITDFGIALKQSAAVAHQAGLSLEDTVTFLALFAKAGLTGSDAGTSLRTALIKLINPTENASAVIRALGVEIRDAQGNIRPDVFAQFAEATAKFPKALRDQELAIVFGQDAIRAAAIAARAGTEGFATVRTEIGKTGTASELATAQTEGLSGAVEQLKNSASELGIVIGRGIAPTIETLAVALTSVFNRFTEIIDVINRAGFAFGNLVSDVNENTVAAESLQTALAGLAGQALRPQDVQPFLSSINQVIDRFTFLQKLQEKPETRIFGSKPAQEFAAAIRDAAQAQKFLNPLLAHNLELVARFAETTRAVPTRKEVSFIINNKTIEASIRDITTDLAALGDKAAQEALTGGQKVSKAFLQSFKDTITGQNFLTDALNDAENKASSSTLGEGIGKQTVEGLSKSISVLLPQVFAATGSTRKTLTKNLESLIAQLGALGPKGKAALRELGAQIMSGLSEGFTSEQKSAVAAANQAVQDAIDQGQKQVHDAVVSAKSNLGSITSSLAGAVGQVLDARAEAAIAALDKSPLAREIKFLTGELDKTNVAQQRSNLQFQIASATDDASRRSAIAQLTQFDLQTKLNTDQKKLQSEKDNIKKTADAQKEAITRNLAAYADQFARGQITLARFSTLVLNTLNTQEGPFSKVGNLLGSAFKTSFKDQINAVLEQAKELAKFVDVAAGGTTQVGVVKPAENLAASQKAVADAQAARDKVRDGFLQSGNVILADINKAIRTLPAAGPGQATTAQRARSSQRVK